MKVTTQKYYVYIVTNFKKTVLYTGVTNSLEQRIVEHYLDRGKTNSFTAKYHTYYLLYYESFDFINNAIAREKEIKGWSRNKKETLIASLNPKMEFLNIELFDEWPPKDLYHRRDV
jgi:putative endonuclease